MRPDKYIEGAFEDLRRALEKLRTESEKTLVDMARVILKAFRGRHKLFCFGNGGSAADAQHIAAEFVNKFRLERPPFPAIALTTDTSILTSVSNDRSFSDVFVRQLGALAEAGDVALGLSTSGRSENVVRALRWAREHGLYTLGLSGPDKTDMDVYCDLIVHVPIANTPRIQECHIFLAHLICGMVEILYMEETSGDLDSPGLQQC
ncbi:D-sedoheptulose-7-phosphate isomerase [Thermodesulforhabdus norvegica]|uniref:Phosphoheptose isomerase n=1 Tax=Thermodesulforhabdus norvegica TaxID=39841 RepID=A0A1I4U5R7_9BACT|nr:SIS domain-containing protein [Thermodesulforhabdus norvegica]SFM84376.1 phosphoheptose isomerase [Thermodesulforhabdus norvegica]